MWQSEIWKAILKHSCCSCPCSCAARALLPAARWQPWRRMPRTHLALNELRHRLRRGLQQVTHLGPDIQQHHAHLLRQR